MAAKRKTAAKKPAARKAAVRKKAPPRKKAPAKKSIGRPSLCNAKVTERICERLAAGESLRSICAEEGMPAMSSILLWVVSGRNVDGTDKPFSEHYMQAREAGGYAHADRVINVIDMVGRGELDANQARAMLDGLKWAAERMAPKKHSPRQEIDHSSSDGSMATKPTTIQLVGPGESEA